MSSGFLTSGCTSQSMTGSLAVSDMAACGQVRDVGLSLAQEVPVDEVVVLSELRRRPPDRASVVRQLRYDVLHAHPAQVRVIELDQVLAFGVGRISQDVLDCEDGRCHYIELLHDRYALGQRPA